MVIKMLKIVNIILFIIAILLIVLPTFYVVKKEYNDNLWLVTNKKVIEAANRCRNEDKCLESKVTITTLKENGYLDLVVNPITKEVINPESYVDLDSNTFVMV